MSDSRVHFNLFCTSSFCFQKTHLIIISFSSTASPPSTASAALALKLDWLQIKGKEKMKLFFYMLGSENYHRFNRSYFLCATLNTLRHFSGERRREKSEEEEKSVGNFNYKHQHHVEGIINKYQHKSFLSAQTFSPSHRIVFSLSFLKKTVPSRKQEKFPIVSTCYLQKNKKKPEEIFLPPTSPF